MKIRSTLFRFRKQVALVLSVFTVISTATAAQAPEIRRHLDNSNRIAKMHPYMQPKAWAMISDLESHGQKPTIGAQVHRSPAEQAELKRRGLSTLSYSFHNVTDKDANGKAVPASFAADFYDYYRGYKVPESFWLLLASSAQHHDLTTGVYWGLSDSNRRIIRELVARGDWNGEYKRGWDAGHAEPLASVLTPTQARKGKRPPVRKVATR